MLTTPPIAAVAPQIVQTRLGAVEFARVGEGPAVLMLHGAMGGWDQALMLARAGVGLGGFDFLAVSRPGYLRTPLADCKTPAAQADLCAALLDSLAIRHTAVAAISGGGQCALQFALRHPHRCRALVMISACSAPVPGSVPFRFHVMTLMAHIPALVSRMRRRIAADPETAAARSIPDLLLRAQTLSDPDAGPLLREFQLSTFDHLADRLAGTRNDIAQSRAPFVYEVENIQAPALVVHGSADEAVPFSQAGSLAARLHGAVLLAVPDGRHVSLFTHRRLIQPRVRQFLEQHA